MRTKIVVPMVLLAAIPAILINLFLVSQTRQVLWELTAQRVAFDTAVKGHQLDEFLQGLREDLLSLSRVEAIRRLAERSQGSASEGSASEGSASEGSASEGSASEGSASEGSASERSATLQSAAESELLRFARGRKAYCGVRCLNGAGHEVLRLQVQDGRPTVVPTEALPPTLNEGLRRATAADEGDWIDIVTVSPTLEEKEIADLHPGLVRYVTPFYARKGGEPGMLMLNICIGHLLELISPLPARAEAWLVDESGFYLGYLGASTARSREYSLETKRHLSADYTPEQVKRILSPPGPDNTLELDDRLLGITSFALDVHEPSRRWTLLVAYELPPLVARMQRVTLVFWLSLALLISVTAVVGLLISHYLTLPIGWLRKATREIAAGDLSRRVEIATGDELQGLATDFNTMTERLKEAQEQLSQWNVELEREVAQQTERLQALQSGLAKTDKLASIGQMTAGVLHEVGNPLAAFKTKIQVAQEGEELCDNCRTLLPELLTEVDRLTTFLRSFSRLARLPDPQVECVDLASIIEGVETLIAPELGRRGSSLKVELEDAIPPIVGDANQLRQMLINLILNASEASEEGQIVVRAFRARGNGHPGPLSRIEVIDEGSGIAPEILHRIWDPFYSTKPSGTGLGLAICRQIVSGHQGEIDIRSEAGKGTVVTTTFPAAAQCDPPEGRR